VVVVVVAGELVTGVVEEAAAGGEVVDVLLEATRCGVTAAGGVDVMMGGVVERAATVEASRGTA